VESLARLRLISQTGTAAHVSEVLGIVPSYFHEVGDLIRNSERSYESSSWHLDSAQEIEEGVELADCLRQLLDRVEPAAASLWHLEGEGYRVSWPCILGTHTLEHSVELDRQTLQRLIALPGDLWLDIYEAVPDDLAAARERWDRRQFAPSGDSVRIDDLDSDDD
jgi:Domain of unknown function (DUF4279)